MDALDKNIKLSQAQIYLLKNISVLADVPITAKDIFAFLGIGDDSLLQYFDALHSLVPQWLEYKNSYYVFPSDRAQKFLKHHPLKVNDLYRLISFFRRLYSTPGPGNRKKLERYEPYLLAILNNFKQPSVLLAQLHTAYAQYLGFKEKYDQALMALQRGAGILQQVTPDSPLLAQVWNEMAFIYLKKNNVEKAFQLAQKARDTLNRLQQDVTEIRINTEFILGEVFFKTKQYNQAINHFLRTIDLINKTSYPQHRLQVYVFLQLSDAFRYVQKYEKAEFYLQQAEKTLSNLSPHEVNIFGEQIRLQKKALAGLSFLAKLKAKFMTYVLLAVIFLTGLIMILIVLSLIFR